MRQLVGKIINSTSKPLLSNFYRKKLGKLSAQTLIMDSLTLTCNWKGGMPGFIILCILPQIKEPVSELSKGKKLPLVVLRAEQDNDHYCATQILMIFVLFNQLLILLTSTNLCTFLCKYTCFLLGLSKFMWTFLSDCSKYLRFLHQEELR